MARIRSVHPGLFTDETFMAASPHARLLMIGLWTEADDQGVFEWKPLTLKARLLPVDTVDLVALLSEIEGSGVIQQFDHEGKAYGAIRNFRKFQRPQKPNPIHPLPDHLRGYVGLSRTPTVPVRDPYPTDPRKPDPMEGEGGSGKEGKEENEKRESSLSASRISDNWEPSIEGKAFARSRGVPEDKLAPEAEKFRLRWKQKTGPAALCADWEAAWQQWVIRSCEFNKYEPDPDAGEQAKVFNLTIWIPDDDRRWPRLADRFKAERGKWPMKLTSEAGPGVGSHFPREWIDALSAAA